MLFWIAYMRDTDCSQETVRNITTQIFDLRLNLCAFGGKNGDLVASACGLLALISCVRQNCSKNTFALDAVRQAARWIVVDIAKENNGTPQSAAWAYYALCEYIDLESTIKWR